MHEEVMRCKKGQGQDGRGEAGEADGERPPQGTKGPELGSPKNK